MDIDEGGGRSTATDTDLPMDIDVVVEGGENENENANAKYVMSKFEQVAVVQRRVMQLTRGIDGYSPKEAGELLGFTEAEVLKTPEPELMVAIAHTELQRRKIRFVLRRRLHDGTVVDRVPVSEMVVPEQLFFGLKM